ncbi:unnamed protein product [Sphagnum troendelagicum]|uniref:Uncharacterized protein n=1 Tax=Sphagnum jensenii TaxID=128206 RepID=A0ABP0WNT2_9BRYO
MSNVSARVQSWRKFGPANSFAHAESQVSSKCKNMVQDEEAAFKGSDLGSAPSKCCLRFTSLVLWLCMTLFSTAVLLAVTCLLYWIVCHPNAPTTTLKVQTWSPRSSMNSLINLNM